MKASVQRNESARRSLQKRGKIDVKLPFFLPRQENIKYELKKFQVATEAWFDFKISFFKFSTFHTFKKK